MKAPRKSTSDAPPDPVTAYALRVTSGAAIAGPPVRDACARHFRDLEHGKERGLRWDPDAARWTIGFFRDALCLNGGEHEGRPFILHESQEFIVGSLFGWKRADGYRRFRMAYIEEAKGTGKSPLAAGIGIYMCVADGEPRAEGYSAAVDRDQAGILFRDAVAMVRLSDDLSAKALISGGEGREQNIAFLDSGSFFRPVSSESSGRGKSGYRPHFVGLDEIHEHPTNAMVEFMLAGIKGRRQPLIFMITNSGFDRTSVCYEYHAYARKVAAREVEDDDFFSYVCAVDEGEDPFTDEPDPALGYPHSWAKTNPLIGVTVPVSYLEGQVRQARGMPAKESLVRRLNFCQWVDAENPWIDGDMWMACEVDSGEFPDTSGMPAALGLDLSSRRDLTAAARVVRLGDGRVAAELQFWTPRDTLQERERLDRAPYDAWVRAGHLHAEAGRTLDYGFTVRDLAERGWITDPDTALAFDRWRIEDFQKALDEAGIESWIWEGPDAPAGSGLRMVRHLQGFGGGGSDSALWMPRSINALEELILQGKLIVRRNPVLTWNNASAVIEQDAAGNKKWEKRKSTGRIDGVVALSMAVGLLLAEDEPPESGIHVFSDGDGGDGLPEEPWW